MAKVKITLNYQIEDGTNLSFRAPCNCTAVDGLTVTYPRVTENTAVQTTQNFSFKDAHGGVLTGLGNVFSTGALVKVLLDVTTGSAYIQNAGTNSYLENALATKAPLEHTQDVSHGGTGATTKKVAKQNLGIYFSNVWPTEWEDGDIWLKPL